MLSKITSAPKKVASHVKERRGRYGTAAGFIAGAVVTRKLDASTLKEALAFIEEKGLDNEFWNPEV